MKFKSTLSCLLILISIVATFSPITEVFCDKNSLLKNFKDVSSSIAKALEDPVSSSLPDPDVYEIDYPSSITLGESAYITIRGKNRGDDANEGDLSMSFPDNPSDVEITGTDASNRRIAWPGDLIWVGYGDHREPAEYPLAEVWEAPWRAGSTRYLTVRVTPEATKTFTFYVKMVAEAGGVWYGDPKTDGSESSRRDQQNEYVYKHTIQVDPAVGSLTVRVKYPDGSYIPTSELNALVIYWDSSYDIVEPLPDNPYTFTDLSPNDYLVEAYVNDMYSHDTGWVYVGGGDSKSRTIYTPEQGKLRIQALCEDGSTPLLDAYVEVESQDGTVWRSDTTGADGWTTWFWLQPSNIPPATGEYYKAKVYYDGSKRGESGQITFDPSKSKEEDVTTDVPPPEGSLTVYVRYPDGSLISTNELNALVIYWDSSYDIVEPLPDNPYTFTDLSPNDYLVEAYVNDMYSHDTGWVSIGPGDSKSKSIYVPTQGSLRIQALYSDGVTPLSGAYVEVESQDGTVWRSDTTGADGWTVWFWLQPTNIPPATGEFYRAKVYYEGYKRGESEKITFSAGESEEVGITTDVTPPSGSLTVYVRYPDGSLVPTTELNALVIYWDSDFEIVEPLPDNPYTFGDLDPNDYLVEAYVNDMYSHDTSWVSISVGDSKSNTIYIPAQGSLRIQALCNDGVTPLSGAYVEVESHDGTVWRSDTTGADGWTVRFWLQPTNVPPATGEFYKAKIYYDGYKRGESDEITFASGESKEVHVTSDVSPPMGSLTVYVKYPSGSLVATSELNALVIYWDSDFQIIEPLPDNPYTFSDLSTNDYLVEAYVNDMYSHDTGWVSIGPADSKSRTIYTPEQGKLRIQALCNDGSTPLLDAYVEVESHDGTVWRSDKTDSDGWTTWFWLQPTNVPPATGEFYKAKIYYEDSKHGESGEITFAPSESQEIAVTTDVPPPEGSLTVYVRYPDGSLISTDELNALVIYWDSSHDIVEPVPNNPYTFTNLSPNDYLVEAYVNDMYSYDTSWVYIGRGDSKSETIYVPAQGSLRIRVLYDEGSTPLSDAYVEVESHDGTVWRSDDTDSDGWTTWFWLQPTNVPPATGEFYRAKVYYEGYKRGESGEITFSAGESEEVGITTDVTLPKGNLTVYVRYPDGSLVSISELNALVMYRDSSYSILEPLADNPYTFTDLSPNDYLVEAYVNDMYSHDTGWISVGPAESRSTSIYVPAQGSLRVQAFCNDGTTPLSDAYVEVESHDGTVWRSDKTDSDGWTTWFWLQPTNVPPATEEYYKAKVYFDGTLRGESGEITFSSGDAEEVGVTTDLPVLSAEITFANIGSRVLIPPNDYACEPNEDILIRLGAKNTGTTELHLRVVTEIWHILAEESSTPIYSSSLSGEDKELWLEPDDQSPVIEFEWTVPTKPNTPAYVVQVTLKDWDNPATTYDYKGGPGDWNDAPVLHVPYENDVAVLQWLGIEKPSDSFSSEVLEFLFTEGLELGFSEAMKQLSSGTISAIAGFAGGVFIGWYFTYVEPVGWPSSIDACVINTVEQTLQEDIEVFQGDDVPIVISLYTGDEFGDVHVCLEREVDTQREEITSFLVPLYTSGEVGLFGSYEIFFKNTFSSLEPGVYYVKASFGPPTWVESEVQVTVKPKTIDASIVEDSIHTEKSRYAPGETVYTFVSAENTGNVDSEFWIRADIWGPKPGEAPHYIVRTEPKSLTIPEGSVSSSYALSWTIPGNAVPGTYIVVVSIFDENPMMPGATVLDSKGDAFSFMIDKQVSYIEIWGRRYPGGSVPEGRVVHIHLAEEDLEKLDVDVVGKVFDTLSVTNPINLLFSDDAMTRLHNQLRLENLEETEMEIQPDGSYDLSIDQLRPIPYTLIREYGLVYQAPLVDLAEEKNIDLAQTVIEELIGLILKKWVELPPSITLPRPIMRIPRSLLDLPLWYHSELSLPSILSVETRSPVGAKYNVGENVIIEIKVTDESATNVEGCSVSAIITPRLNPFKSIAVDLVDEGDGIYGGTYPIPTSGYTLYEHDISILVTRPPTDVQNGNLGWATDSFSVRHPTAPELEPTESIGGVLTVKSESTPEADEPEIDIVEEIYNSEVHFETEAKPRKVVVKVGSDVSKGRTIVINIDDTTLPITSPEEVIVLYDDLEIGLADDCADVLNPYDESDPEYLLLKGDGGLQVLVSIPHFSTHTITVMRWDELTILDHLNLFLLSIPLIGDIVRGLNAILPGYGSILFILAIAGVFIALLVVLLKKR
jgi:hypothetical protein